MQQDNNLVRYDGFKSAHWATGTDKKGAPGAICVLENEGALTVYDGDRKVLWSSNTARPDGITKQESKTYLELTTGQSLEVGQSLRSANSHYFAVLQPDGNFVVYVSHHWHPKNALWSSKTNGKGKGPAFYLRLQEDGNFVHSDEKNVSHWASHTKEKGAPGRYLLMQNDGNLVLYDGADKPVWSSNTCRAKYIAK